MLDNHHNSSNPFSSEIQQQQQSDLSPQQEYLSLINDLNQEFSINAPADPLQFCFNFFLKRLSDQRSRTRHAPTTTFIQDSNLHPTSDVHMKESSKIAPMDLIEDNDEQDDIVDDELPTFESSKHLRHRRVSVSAESMQPSRHKRHDASVVPKSSTEIQMISASLQNHFLFKCLEADERQEVIDCMEQKQFHAGDCVIEQGAAGDFFYVVSQGTLDCLVDGEVVTRYQRGGSFGELALMYNAPRAATIRATSDGLLWALDRVSFRSILMDNHAEKRKLHEGFLKSVPLFKSLEVAEIHKIADALEPVSFMDGEVVLKQGDVGDNFYLIEKGEALFYQQTAEALQQVNNLKEGDYFGELALLTDKPRAATVVAKGNLTCVTLGKAAFTRLLGPVMDILKRNTSHYHAILQKVQ